MSNTNAVTETPAAAAPAAIDHFASLLAFETDCWDTNDAMTAGDPGFVLLDVRGKGGFDAGHIPGAVHFPHLDLNEANLADYPADSRLHRLAFEAMTFRAEHHRNPFGHHRIPQVDRIGIGRFRRHEPPWRLRPRSDRH